MQFLNAAMQIFFLIYLLRIYCTVNSYYTFHIPYPYIKYIISYTTLMLCKRKLNSEDKYASKSKF